MIKPSSCWPSWKGIGLIERVKQGQGRPAKIYVKQFTTTEIPQPPAPPPEPEEPNPRLPKTEVSLKS